MCSVDRERGCNDTYTGVHDVEIIHLRSKSENNNQVTLWRAERDIVRRWERHACGVAGAVEVHTQVAVPLLLL